MAEPLSVDIGRAAPLVFANAQEGLDWIEREIKFWSWLSDDGVHSVRKNLGEFPSEIIKRLQLARSAIEKWAETSESDQVISVLHAMYVAQNYPLSTDPIGELAGSLAHGGDAAAAAAAVAAHIGLFIFQDEQQPVPSGALRGMVAASLLSLDIGPLIPQSIADSLKAVAEEFAVRSADAAQKFARQEKSFRELQDDWEKRLLQNEAEILNLWGDKINESIESIKATDAAYSDLMRLKASVDYWTQKAKDHRLSEGRSKRNLIWYAWAASFLLVSALLAIATAASLLGTPENATAVSLKFAAVGAVLTTIALWAGRVMLRIFLSDRHLAADAEERVTMVMTYLALTNEGKIADSDRALVLGPLFRPAADGIVKDDGAPDTTVAAIIGRGLDRNAPGR